MGFHEEHTEELLLLTLVDYVGTFYGEHSLIFI